MSDNKTEQPTQKRLKDAREKGQLARSRDLALAAASVASTIALAQLGRHFVTGLTEHVSHHLAHIGDKPLATLTEGDITHLVFTNLYLIVVLVGPIALATMVAGVGMHGFQGGWSFASGALKLNWSRLNPANGVKRFGVMQSGADTVKTIVTVTIVAALSWSVVSRMLPEMPGLPWMTAASIGIFTWQHAESLLWNVAGALGVLALGDYALQRYRLMSQLKMTKQEVRDELKQMEGNVEVKARARRLHREMARRRMLQDVPRATVVITNPTHLAIALEYRRESMVAPKVIAKGQDHMAARIREKAREHDVPIVENKPLAQALYAGAEVGDTIPAELFAAVAEVLAYLIRIKRLML
jgi:flagellar biosynthetic protein FlhB